MCLLYCLQRTLLERLTALLASVLGSHVPLAMVTLEAMGLLLEILGEVSPSMLKQLEDPVMWKLTSDHACVRAQVGCSKACFKLRYATTVFSDQASVVMIPHA